MIDGLKFRIENPDISRIYSLPFMEWKQTAREKTGEIEKLSAIFDGIQVEIQHGKYIHVSGSIHVYWNVVNGKGKQNFNDFHFSDIPHSIHHLCSRLQIEPVRCKIENIEFGVNVIPTIPADELLKSVINHKGDHFTWEYEDGKQYRQCEHWQYIIKIYNKGLQHERRDNILRFETRIVKMERVRDTGITTLVDLMDKEKISSLGDILFRDFDDLLIYDHSILETDLNSREGDILTLGRIPTYWDDLRKDQRENYFKKRQRFRELVKRHGTQNIQEYIGSLIKEKWFHLLNEQGITLHDLTGGYFKDITGFDPYYIESIPVNLINQAKDQPNDLKRKEPERLIQINKTTPRRFCLSCGREITNQKPGSKFCSAKIVGYEEAHRCRNTDSNPRNRIKYMNERDQQRGIVPLFDTETLIRVRN